MADTYQSLTDYMNTHASPLAYTKRTDPNADWSLDLSNYYANPGSSRGLFRQNPDGTIKQYTGQNGDGNQFGSDQQLWNMYGKDGSVTQGADKSINDGWLNKNFDKVVLAAVAVMGGGAAAAGMAGAGGAAGAAGDAAGTVAAGDVAGTTAGAGFSDAGFAAANPGLDSAYVGSGTATADAGAGTLAGGSLGDAGNAGSLADYSNEGAHYLTPESTATAPGSATPSSGFSLSDLKDGYDKYKMASGLAGTVTGGNNQAGNSGGVGGALGSLYDNYAANQQASSLKGTMDELSNMYKPGSPEAILMQRQMEAKDAAAGRNSQYGPRATDLAAKLAGNRMQVLSSPGYMNLQAAYLNKKYQGAGQMLSQGIGSGYIDKGINGLKSLYDSYNSNPATTSPDAPQDWSSVTFG